MYTCGRNISIHSHQTPFIFHPVYRITPNKHANLVYLPDHRLRNPSNGRVRLRLESLIRGAQTHRNSCRCGTVNRICNLLVTSRFRAMFCSILLAIPLLKVKLAPTIEECFAYVKEASCGWVLQWQAHKDRRETRICISIQHELNSFRPSFLTGDM